MRTREGAKLVSIQPLHEGSQRASKNPAPFQSPCRHLKTTGSLPGTFRGSFQLVAEACSLPGIVQAVVDCGQVFTRNGDLKAATRRDRL